MAEVTVTIVLLRPREDGGYDTEEFPDVIVNTQASVRRITQEIAKELAEYNLAADDLEMMVRAPDGSTLSNVSIQEGSKIVLMPRFTGKAVKFKRNR